MSLSHANGVHGASLRPSSAHELWDPPATLSSQQVDGYLQRIGLDATSIRARTPDLELLAELQLAHLLTVPFEVSAIHFSEADYANTADESIRWRAGPGVSVELDEAYRIVVERRRGGYCFSLNSLYSALLRSLGFKLSMYSARVFRHRNQDPAVTGYDWTALSHVAMLVDLPGGPWLTDVGFGGSFCTRPVSVNGKQRTQSLSKGEEFIIEHEALPGAHLDAVPGAPGYTVYRYFADGIKSPCYYISPSPIPMANFWNSKADEAVWSQQFAFFLLLKDGSRRTCSFLAAEPLKPGSPIEGQLKHVVRSGVNGKISWEEDVPLTYRAVNALLREHYGFR